MGAGQWVNKPTGAPAGPGRLEMSRLCSPTCLRQLSAPFLREGGGGVELRSQRAWGESGSFHTIPAYDLGQLTYPSGPQYPHLENGGLEFMVSEVPLSPGLPAGEVS